MPEEHASTKRKEIDDDFTALLNGSSLASRSSPLYSNAFIIYVSSTARLAQAS